MFTGHMIFRAGKCLRNPLVRKKTKIKSTKMAFVAFWIATKIVCLPLELFEILK